MVRIKFEFIMGEGVVLVVSMSKVRGGNQT